MSKFACLNDSDDDSEVKTATSQQTVTATPHKELPQVKKNVEKEMFDKYYKKPNNYKPSNYSTKTTSSSDQTTTSINGRPNTLTITEKPFDVDLPIIIPLKINAHHVIDISKWDISNFHYVTTLSKWSDIPKFINALGFQHGVSTILDYDLYIMKEHITPLWENQWNKNGSICSILIDGLQEAISLIGKLMMHMVNNSLLINGIDSFNNVNGISFTPKKISSINTQQTNYYLIKIWLRVNYFGTAPEKLICPYIWEIIKKMSVKIKTIRAEY